MVHSRVVFLLVAFVLIGIAAGKLRDDELGLEDGDIAKKNSLEGK